MADRELVVWGIHAERSTETSDYFLQKGIMALGWAEMGDISKINPDRESFKQKMLECYPTAKPMVIAINAGELYRFIHEIKSGDIVVYPSKHDKHVHIGEITGPYKYDKKISNTYPHIRPVNWRNKFPRTHFSQGALYEIGSLIALFQIKNYAEEFKSALIRKSEIIPIREDNTIIGVNEEIVQSTRDYIYKKLAQELKGHPMAKFMGHLLNTMGYRTRISPEGTDGGIDIIAHKDELGFEPPLIKVQVKSGEGTVGDPMVSALYGKVGQNEFGLLVTLGTFTPQAKHFARSKSNLRLIDGEEFIDLILEHYEQFDSSYKAIIPLKRIYAPELIGNLEE
jgi:restriction system protein